MEDLSGKRNLFGLERPFEDFYRDLLASDNAAFLKYREMLQQNEKSTVRTIVVRRAEGNPDDDEAVAEIFRKTVKRWNEDSCAFYSGGMMLIISPGFEDAGPEPERLLELLTDECEKRGLADQSQICVGRSFRSMDDLIHSVSDVFSACGYGMIQKSAGRIIYYEELGTLKILFDWINSIELRKLYYDAIIEINNYDKQNNTEYLDTIVAFCKCAFSVNSSAKSLHMHYNTMVARLLRVKELFGLDLMTVKAQFDTFTCVVVYTEYSLMQKFMEEYIGNNQ